MNCKMCGKETIDEFAPICGACFSGVFKPEPITDEKAHAAQKALGLLNYASGPEAFKKFFGHNLHENLVQLNADGSPRLSGDDETVSDGATTTCRLCGKTMVFDMNTGLTAAHTCGECSQSKCVILFNGEQNTWEAWVDGEDRPIMYSLCPGLPAAMYEFFTDRNFRDIFSKFDVIEVHINDAGR